MNAQPNIEFDLPGLDDVVSAELAIAREDCERLHRERQKCVSALAGTQRQIRWLEQKMQEVREKEGELQLRAGTLKRLLDGRKRIVFEMEQEKG